MTEKTACAQVTKISTH